MDGLILRTWAVGALILVGAAITTYVPPKRSLAVDETWMAQKAPFSVGGFRFQPSTDVPGQSYKMGKSTYDTLEPSGILARIYQDGDKTYDVVLIASDSSKSFHDPRVCFTAQGWKINKQHQASIETKSHGIVPMTFVDMANADGVRKSALYFYKGPNGFESVARKMRMEMLVGQLLHARNEQGLFYRFIPMSDNISDQELERFAARYLDEANRTSGGFF